MKFGNRYRWAWLGTAVVTFFLIMACGLSSNPNPTVSITPTPTIISDIAPEVEVSPVVNKCDGLSGELEMQILVGPADVVGLEPVAVGEIPFYVVSDSEPYLVQGDGAVSYQEILQEAWGTYTVSLDMEGTLSGECRGEPGSEALDITVEMSGEQMVEVRAEEFQGDYPWSGTQTL